MSEQARRAVESLEQVLSEVEAAAADALTAAGQVTRDLKKVKAAASAGQLRDLRRSIEASRAAAEALLEQVAAVAAAYAVDEAEHLSSGAYVAELLDRARADDLTMLEDADRLLVYPSIVRVVGADAALEIDKRRVRALRPSVVVAGLKAAQSRPPRFKPAAFLDALRSGYDHTVARAGKHAGAVVRLDEVHKVLTLLPGQARDYGKQEFVRDLYLLDQAGVTSTSRDPRELHFAASTGSKGAGVLTTVARTGAAQRYWGVSFS